MMALSTSQVDRSTLMFYAMTALAVATKVTSTAITTYLATTFLMSGRISGLAITASAIEIFSLVTLAATIVLFLGRVNRKLMLFTWMSGTAACLSGTILSLITLGLTIHFFEEGVFVESKNQSARAISIGGLVVAALSLAPQAAFFCLAWPVRKRQRVVSAADVQEACISRPAKRYSLTAQLGALAPGSPKRNRRSQSEPTSPSISMFQFKSGSPLQDSTGFILRPMTSKTRLLLGQSFASRDSKSIHSSDQVSEPWRSKDGFETWDTSAVEDSYDNHFSSKPKVTRLETIPGSRPVSPAHPLNGPFRDDRLEPEQMPLPESPLQSPAACASPASETGSIRSFHRPSVRRPDANNQAHIHPLFRTESPTPPPLTSPATVITASPWAGQVVSPDMALGSRVLHSAQSSRPASPIVMSPRSRAGSMRSFRQTTSPTPPVEPFERSASQLAAARTPQPGD